MLGLSEFMAGIMQRKQIYVYGRGAGSLSQRSEGCCFVLRLGPRLKKEKQKTKVDLGLIGI